ncbi:MAG: hypothetical protein AB7N54_00060 [Alphaproteobacteria bacterium]
MAKRKIKPAPTERDETPAWRQVVELFAKALELREHDAVDRIRGAMVREQGLARTALQRASAARRRDGHVADRHAVAAALHDSHADELRALLASRRGRKWTPRGEHDVDRGTPEVALKPAVRDPVYALGESGKLSDAHVSAADEAARLYERLTIGLWGSRRGGLPDAAGRPPKARRAAPSTPLSDRDARLISRLFRPWTERCRCEGYVVDTSRGPRKVQHDMDALLDIVVFRMPIKATASRHGLGYRRLERSVHEALERYLDMRRKFYIDRHGAED